MQRHLATLAAIALSIAATGPLFATDYDIATNGGWWTTATTWNPNVAGGPLSADSITIVNIPAARTLYLNGDDAVQTFTIANLSYNETDSVTILSRDGGLGGPSTRRTLAITGDLTKDGTGTLLFRRLYTVNSNWGLLATVGGDVFVNEGVLAFGNRTDTRPILGLTIGGTTTVAEGAILSLHGPGNSTALSVGTTVLNGTIQTPIGASRPTFRGLSGDGDIEVGTDAGSAITTALFFSPTAGTHNFSGSITQGTNMAYTFTKSGAGQQILSGALAYSGTTQITGGVLRFAGPNAVLSPGNLLISGGVLGLDTGTLARDLGTGAGQIRLTTGGGFAAYANDLSVTIGSDALMTWGGTNFLASGNLILGDATATHRVSLTNPISFANGARTVDVRDGAAAIDATLNGNLTSTGSTGRLIKTGTGTLELAGAGTFQGAMSVQEGVLLLGSTGSVTANYLLEGGILGLGNGDLNRALGTAAGQVRLTTDGSGFVAFGADRLVDIGNGTNLAWGSTANFFTAVPDQSVMALSAANATHTLTFANNLDLNGAERTLRVADGAAAVDAVLSGSIGGGAGSVLRKEGAGTLELTGDNSYAGGTVVAGGLLLINNTSGSGTGLGPISVDGGTLGGNGAMAGRLTVAAGATLAPGNSAGILTVGELDLQSGSTFEVELFGPTAGSGYDQVVVTGNYVNLENGAILDLVFGYPAKRGDSFLILDNQGGDTDFSGLFTYNSTLLTEGATFNIGLYLFDITYAHEGGSVLLTVLIPEPTSLALLALASLGLLRRRRA